MFIRFTAALAAGLLLGTAAQANQISNQLTIGCTGSLNITGTDGLTMYCKGGDLSIGGWDGGIGTLNSDIGIDLFASGALDLDRVTLSAPTIRLTGGQRVAIASNVALYAPGGVNIAVNLADTSLGQPSLRDVVRWEPFNIGEAGSVVVHSGSSSGDLTVFGAMPQQDRSAIHGALRTSSDIVLVNHNGAINLAGQGGITLAASQTVFGGSVAISSAVPEPGSFALLGVGLLGIAATRYRRR